MSAIETQIGGDHYDMRIQPVVFIARNNWDFFSGNILKYVVRWRKKNGLNDLLKARHYADLRLELLTQFRVFNNLTMDDFIKFNRLLVDDVPLLMALEEWVQGRRSYLDYIQVHDEYIALVKS